MTWHINKGRPPRDKTVKLAIEWACGVVSRHTYTAGQLVWDLRGWDYDIGRFAKMEG